MQKWEYMVVDSGSSFMLPSELNAWGKQGWELVTVTANSDASCTIAYFKRPITE